MKKQIVILLLGTFLSCPARADMFGGDVAVLTQILVQAVQQLIQLKNLVDQTGDAIGVLDQVRATLNTLRRFQTDPGIFADWNSVEEAQRKLEVLFGEVPHSPDEQLQKNADQGIAEAITSNNLEYKFADELDNVAEEIKAASRSASPGGAEKLTAQALGLVIQALDQNLRAQATSNKLQAHSMAIAIHQEKEGTRSFLSTTGQLSSALKTEKADFQIPRF